MCRIMAAFTKLELLSYNGDTLQFQSNFLQLACKRELDACRATVTHLIMTLCRLMKAFEGRSKTVQFKIAEDFNRLDLDDPNINLYELVQGYFADLATVGDAKSHVHCVGMVSADCKSEAHMADDCPKRKQLELNESNRARTAKMKADNAARASKNHAHLTMSCHACSKLGHISPNYPETKVVMAQQQGTPEGNSTSMTQTSQDQTHLVAQSILSSSFLQLRTLLLQLHLLQHNNYGSPVDICMAALTNTAPLPPQVLSASVSQLRSGNKPTPGLVIWCQDSTQNTAKPPVDGCYDACLADTSAMSHDDLEAIIFQMRKESSMNEPVLIVGGSDNQLAVS